MSYDQMAQLAYGLKTVDAVFPNNNTRYSYLVPDGDEPIVGDLLLTSVSMESAMDEADEPASGWATQALLNSANVARVISVGYMPNPKATKFYLVLISHVAIQARREQNIARVKDAKKKAEIRVKLDKLLLEQDRMAQYRVLAGASPEAAALLAELEK